MISTVEELNKYYNDVYSLTYSSLYNNLVSQGISQEEADYFSKNKAAHLAVINIGNELPTDANYMVDRELSLALSEKMSGVDMDVINSPLDRIARPDAYRSVGVGEFVSGFGENVSRLASNKGIQMVAAAALAGGALNGAFGTGANTQAGMLAAQDAGFAGLSTFAPETMAAFQAGMPVAQQAALTAQGLAAQGLGESAISSALTQAGFSEGIATVAAQDAAMGAVGFGSNMSLPSTSSGSSFLDKAGDLLNPSTQTGGSLWNTLGNLGGAALASSYTDEQINRTRQIAADAAKAAEFKPYTISTPTSSVNMTKDALNVNLSPNQQTMFNNLEAQALQASQTNPYVDPQGLFNTMLSTVTPQNERDRLALEQRMAAQGRLGVATAAYGGTPEQLALAKAQQEALNTMALNSQLKAGELTGQNIQNRGGMMEQMYAPVTNARMDAQQALAAQEAAQKAAWMQGGLLMQGENAVAAALAKQQNDYLNAYNGMLGGTNASRTVNDVISAGKSVYDVGSSIWKAIF